MRRERRESPFPEHDGDLADLQAISSALTDLSIEPPAGFRKRLAGRLPALAETSVRSRLLTLGSALPTVTAAIAVALIVIVVRTFFDAGVVSASEILTRSDDALKGIVHPGQLLYRRWAVQSTTTGREGATREGRLRTIK